MADWPRPTEAQIENGIDTLISIARISRDLNGPIDAPESTWEPNAKQRRRFHLIVDHVLRADAKYRHELEQPAKGPAVINWCTRQWVPVAAEDMTEFMDDPEAFANRAQERFRDEWDAEHPEDTHG